MQARKSVASIVPYSPGRLVSGAWKLASNENPLGPSPMAVEAMKAALASGSVYPDGGCVALKEALAASWGLTPEHFVVGNGSDEIIQLATLFCVEPGMEGVTSEATFSEYTFAVKLAGAQMRYAPLRDGRFQLGAIAGLLGEKTKIVYLCNPNNPTGTYYTQSELDAFLAKVGDDTLVVLDEAYWEYVDAPDFPKSVELLKSRDNVLILHTFSKVYGLAGLRVGYGMGSPALIREIERTRAPFNVNSLAQAGAVAALGDRDFVGRSRKANAAGLV